MNCKRIGNSIKLIGIKICQFGLKKKRMLSLVGFMAVSFLAQAQNTAGSQGFVSATSEVKSYKEPVQNLMYAIAGVIALVGAFNVYFKMQNGDQDVKKTIMMTVGGCVAMIAMATALPKFFGW